MIILPFVARGTISHDRLRIGTARCVHAERLKNALVEELPVRFAARLLNDNAKQIIAGVIVRPRFPWLKLKRQLEKHLEQLISRRGRFKSEIGSENVKLVRDRDMVLNTGCMREQVPNCDAAPRLWRLRKIFRDCVVQTDLTFFDQHHDCGGGKLLRSRTDFVNSFFRRRRS